MRSLVQLSRYAALSVARDAEWIVNASSLCADVTERGTTLYIDVMLSKSNTASSRLSLITDNCITSALTFLPDRCVAFACKRKPFLLSVVSCFAFR